MSPETKALVEAFQRVAFTESANEGSGAYVKVGFSTLKEASAAHRAIMAALTQPPEREAWPTSTDESDRLLFRALMTHVIFGDGSDPGEPSDVDLAVESLTAPETWWAYRAMTKRAAEAFTTRPLTQPPDREDHIPDAGKLVSAPQESSPPLSGEELVEAVARVIEHWTGWRSLSAAREIITLIREKGAA